MANLEEEAKQHFNKLEQSIAYHENRLKEEIPEGIKYQIKREIAAMKFSMEYAKEALTHRGIEVL